MSRLYINLNISMYLQLMSLPLRFSPQKREVADKHISAGAVESQFKGLINFLINFKIST